MAKRPVEGKDIILLVGDGGETEVFNPIVCLTSNSWNASRDIIEAATKCGTYQLTNTLKHTCSMDGVVMVAPDADEVVADDLYDYLVDDEYHNFKLGPASPTTGDVVYAFRGKIASYNMTASQDGAATFTSEVTVDSPTVVKTVTS